MMRTVLDTRASSSRACQRGRSGWRASVRLSVGDERPERRMMIAALKIAEASSVATTIRDINLR